MRSGKGRVGGWSEEVLNSVKERKMLGKRGRGGKRRGYFDRINRGRT
jgi:hypothetical protein